ncbi:hypothetical protein KAR91_05895 [Candidatus Pacearchaeota archaeon]|nr:hypothetical protein [Candidatus Pacearchaeota archaeon]
MINIRIDDSQIMEFTRRSPARAKWASSEALKMAGGHYRGKLRKYIEEGGENWQPLSETTRKIKRLQGQVHMTPLYGLGQFIRFRYGVRAGVQRVTIGFLNAGVTRIARLVQYGGRKRVSDARRRFYHRMGIHLRATTKYITVPARPILVPFWRRHERGVQTYIERRFFEKFFSGERARIAI